MNECRFINLLNGELVSTLNLVRLIRCSRMLTVIRINVIVPLKDYYVSVNRWSVMNSLINVRTSNTYNVTFNLTRLLIEIRSSNDLVTMLNFTRVNTIRLSNLIRRLGKFICLTTLRVTMDTSNDYFDYKNSIINVFEYNMMYI